MRFLLLLLFSFNLMAQTSDPRQDKKHACASDMQTFCKDEMPSDANFWGCLGRKMNLLSPKCSEFMAGIYTRLNDCGSDILALCEGNQKNYGNWYKCIDKRRGEVSKKCQKMLDGIGQRYKDNGDALKACSKEKAKHCATIDERQCLPKIRSLAESELSPECKSKLAATKH